ncbi:Heterotrimeric G-protein alpha subunit [Mycena sanguinolenta]|uniref:Heterotrimeric G-protein alpha subunit n=1 Tax=Mycena sanguinolenta TaxID=230812 RepID=A0A8H6XTL4_9AGAR|nr:Heterotrimeric G-protein alpha subunit [Mycena sanguinolenta]
MAPTFLPQSNGWLPYFLVFTGASALIHSAVCYVSPPSTALAIFSGPNRPTPTSLLAHVYATKNMYTGAIRLYAAYHIANAQLYNLAAFTFVGVLGLNVSEMLLFGTVRMREGLWPFVTAGTGLAWMVLQREWYLGA